MIERIRQRVRRIRLITGIIRELPLEQRQALLWFRIDRLSPNAIAERLRISEPLAKELIADAYTHIGKRLKELSV